MKKIVIFGGTGFIGKHLIREILQKNWDTTLVVRDVKKAASMFPQCKIFQGNPLNPGSWQDILKDTQVVINLLGQSIFGRWTKEYKTLIWESRVKVTQNIVEGLKENTFLINASAVGYYGERKDEIVTEDFPPGNDFLARLCVEWEKQALKAKEKNCKVAITRFGIVLGKGGMLGKILPIFNLGLGGTLGKGNQWFSWIHINDLVQGIIFLIENQKEGIFNFTSPYPVTNKEFTKTLGQVLKRPTFLKVPMWVLKIVFGELALVITSSIRAIPKNLSQYGFSFKFPVIRKALEDILRKEENEDI